MASVTNNNWYNLNSTRKYPLDDGCTGIDNAGKVFPATAIVDLNVSLKKSLGLGVMISSVSANANLVSVTFLAINHPIKPSLYDSAPPALYFSPLCLVTVKKPVRLGVPYRLSPLVDGVAGWIVFGEGVNRTINSRFSTPIQSAIAPKACRYYNDFPVTSVGKLGSAEKLTGLVRLQEGRDISITKETRFIQGENKEVIVFALRENAENNVLRLYTGTCGGRPESNSCGRVSVEYLNTVQPNCDGNIDITFPEPFVVAEGGSGRLSLDYPVGLNDACTKADRLPDSSGRLPGQYDDLCNPDSEGDPDGNIPLPVPVLPSPVTVSSSTIDYTGLPACINFDDQTAQSWQVVKGQFDITETDSPMELCPIILGIDTSSVSPGVSSSFPIHVYGAYRAIQEGERNVSLWYNPAYTSTLNIRLITDVRLTSRNVPANGAIILNYRANAAGITDEYYLVEINRKESAFVIKKFNGASFIAVVSAEGLGIALDSWYRIKVEVTPGTAGKTRIDAYLYSVQDYPENPLDLLSYLNCEVSNYAPYTGKVGLGTINSEAAFSFFIMENI